MASLGSPTSLAFTPDGRVLVTTQTGRLRIIKQASLLVTPALDLSSRLCPNQERGLLGIAVDPEFTSNGYIYLYFTSSANGCVNRVSRFLLGVDDLVEPTSEFVLIDNVPSGAIHNAGDLFATRDGELYVSIGDAGNGANARLNHMLTGKILRITTTGGIPVSNPFQGTDSARCNVTGGAVTKKNARRFSLRNFAIRSGSRSIPIPLPPGFSSTTSVKTLGRKSTRDKAAPTTAGMCGRDTARRARPATAVRRRQG